MRDLVIVGAGPAGLAAAVYGASEGPQCPAAGNVLAGRSKLAPVRESRTILAFLQVFREIVWPPEPTHRHHRSSALQMLLAERDARLICEHKPYVIELADGARVPARAVMIATGAKYRKLAVENLSRFEGVGVYYGATFIEAQLCKDEEVIVVGGGNSAGQAAVFLAESAKHVFVVVRSDGLADTMSRYLIRRIEETPNHHGPSTY